MEMDESNSNHQQSSKVDEKKNNSTFKEGNSSQNMEDQKSFKIKNKGKITRNEGNKNNKEFKSSTKNQDKEIQKQKKIVIQKTKIKQKSSVNPFLSTTDFEHKRPNTNSILRSNPYLKVNSYILHYQSQIYDLKEQNPKNSIFSRLSEKMYEKTKEEIYPKKKELDLQKDGEEKYDKLTEEIYLFNNATKSNKKNQTIINEFLERKKNEELANKIGLDQEKENELEHFKDNKRISIITDRDTSLKPRRTFIEFYEDQINKQEKHKNHLMENEKKHNNKISSNVLSKPVLNEETIKIANKIKRNDNIEIHQRLYDEYNVIKQQKEMKEKKVIEKLMSNKKEKKIPKKNNQKNIERLYGEYETKKKRLDENERKKEKELNTRLSNIPSNKTSNKIIFNRFKKILVDGINNILDKKLEEPFEINFSDFTKLLFKINFTTKNYYELIEQSLGNEENEIIPQNPKLVFNSKQNNIISNKNKFKLDQEYKLLIGAWKIITKNKEFKQDILGSSQRLLIFLLSVLGIYDGNNNNSFIKKEFSFIIKDDKDDNTYSNLSNQIYKYFAIFRNNTINGLLFREKTNKRIKEIKDESESLLTFHPIIKNRSRSHLSESNALNKMKLSVDKNYKVYQRNKELKLKEKEKLLETEEKKKCPFIPSGAKNIDMVDVSEISERLYYKGLKHSRTSNSSPINFYKRDEINNQYIDNLHQRKQNLNKMFDNNPLESDINVKKKIKEMEESRNKKAYEKLILQKGFIAKKNKGENDFNLVFDENCKRFDFETEPSNTFKNTFERYEMLNKKNSNRKNKEKFEFEIIVENKPQKLVIYKCDDINCKVKEFCNLYKLSFDDKKLILHKINDHLNGIRIQ